MPSDFSFRLSTYLSLALACLCLGYAEADLLPSGAVLAGAVLVCLLVAFRTEGRFELGLAAANRVGVVLFVAAGVWLVTQYADRQSLIHTVPWPGGLLPYIGTTLLVGLAAKLLRPKHAGDWWAVQLIGLVCVALACALAEDVVFGLLLGLYAVTAVGALTLFYLKREAGQVPPAPPEPWLLGLPAGLDRLFGVRPDAAPPAVVASAPARVRGAWRPAVGWLVVALAVALPLFFLTPRSAAPRWSVTGTALETGYDSPQMTDLTRTGDLRVNREVAFEVRVTDHLGQPVDGLPLGQRWRGVAFGLYEHGRWRGPALRRLIDPSAQAVLDQVQPAGPPPLAPGLLRADYLPAGRTSEPPVADPVRWRAGAGSPVQATGRKGRDPGGLGWIHKPDGTFNARFLVAGNGEGYTQTLYPADDPDDPDLGTGFGPYPPAVANPAPELRDLPAGLLELPARTRRLLDELVAAGRVPARVTASDGFRRDGSPAPADWEAVARGFREHLANAGFEYTLRLTRKDKQSDPIEDFLFRTKAGNCERFAAALVLQCRAVRVPARYVLGFKGHEPLGDGRYQVRQDHAHAWAEVLVVRPGPDGTDRWHWLSLDPTPDGGDEADQPDTLLATAATRGRTFFSEFIVGYNADRRRQAAAEVGAALSGPDFLLALGLLLTLVGAVAFAWRLLRRVRRRVVPPPPAVEWYDRLVLLLSAAGHPPPTGSTPLGYARTVGRRLAARPATAGVSGVPARLAELFYRERFGGRPPSDAERATIDAELVRLQQALTTPAGG